MAKSKESNPDIELRRSIADYQINRATFLLCQAQEVREIVGGKKNETRQARRSHAFEMMGIQIADIEREVQRCPPQTAWACVELLEVAEQILASQEDSLEGVLSRGDVRRLMLATLHGLRFLAESEDP